MDIAAAASIYAKRQKLGEEAIGYAHSIKIEALRKLGEMLKETPRAKGGQPYQQNSTCSKSEQVETLPNLGLDRKTSMVAQRLAALPEEDFENVKTGTVTISKAIRMADMERRRNEPIPQLPDGKYRIIYADPPWQYVEASLLLVS